MGLELHKALLTLAREKLSSMETKFSEAQRFMDKLKRDKGNRKKTPCKI